MWQLNVGQPWADLFISHVVVQNQPLRVLCQRPSLGSSRPSCRQRLAPGHWRALGQTLQSSLIRSERGESPSVSPEKMQRVFELQRGSQSPSLAQCRTPIATFFPHSLGPLCQLCARLGSDGEGDRHGHTTAGGQPRDKGWVWGEGHRAGKWVLVGGRAAALGRRRESPPGRKWVGVRAIRMGHLRLWRVAELGNGSTS